MDRRAAAKQVRTVFFDTDILIWYFRGSTRAKTFVQRIALSRRAVSALTEMELVQGCRNRQEVDLVAEFVRENIPLVLYPDEVISRRAVALLEVHAASHGLRVVDALIAASALAESSQLATANVKHYRVVEGLRLLRFKPETAGRRE